MWPHVSGDVCPDKCWFAVLCQFWLQCSRRLKCSHTCLAMYVQTNVGLLCCVGSGSNVASALHSATVFNSHAPCHTHATPMPCSDHAVLKDTSQGHGTARQGHGMGTAWYVWISLKDVNEENSFIVSCFIAMLSCYSPLSSSAFIKACNRTCLNFKLFEVTV